VYLRDGVSFRDDPPGHVTGVAGEGRGDDVGGRQDDGHGRRRRTAHYLDPPTHGRLTRFQPQNLPSVLDLEADC
jgi:hypothetical protein